MANLNFIKDFKEKSKNENWDLGNKILYDMCKDHINHTKKDEIIAKLWLIGRSYSASVERRKTKDGMKTDEFYNFIANELIELNEKEHIDEQIREIKSFDEATLPKIIRLHKILTDFFSRKDITRLNKRSLASKYLHFHTPVFPIYDSIASKNLKKLNLVKIKFDGNGDKEYAIFCYHMLDIKNKIEGEGFNPTIREIDTFLLNINKNKP